MPEPWEKIIDAAIHAPSGDNCQPWEFEMDKNSLLLHLLPDRDNSLYSWGQRASLIALGAAIENMVVAGNKLGFSFSVNLFPDSSKPRIIARLTAVPARPQDEPLYDSILKRCTNRKPYGQDPLLENQKKYLLASPIEVGGSRIYLTETKNDVEILAKAASVNEKILFENFEMHKFFYDHIIWTAEEELQKRMGFYVKTLEVPGYAMPSFKLAKNWKILKFLNLTGFSNIIAKTNFKTYGSCSNIGAIIIPDNSEKSYISAGRLFQRVWLKTTKEELSLQPLTGICLLMQKILSGSATELSQIHQNLVRENYQIISERVNAGKETVALLFRIGTGPHPSARTLRLPAKVIIKD